MKKVLFSLTLIAAIGLGKANAQLNVGSKDAPDASAALQISSNEKGLRLPQVSLANTNAYLSIGNPSDATIGMQIYNTNPNIIGTIDYPATGIGIYTWDGSGWKNAASNNNDIVFLAANGPEMQLANNSRAQLGLGEVYKMDSKYIKVNNNDIVILKDGLYEVEFQGNFTVNTSFNRGGTFSFLLGDRAGTNSISYVESDLSGATSMPYVENGTVSKGTILQMSKKGYKKYKAGHTIGVYANDYGAVGTNGFNISYISIRRISD